MNTAKRSEQSGSSSAFPHEEMVGAIAASATLKLHSRLASNLWLGRPADPARNLQPIVGLARFGRQLSTIWQESAKNNPFADLVLIRIEQRYEEVRELLQSNLSAVKDLLDGQQTFDAIEGGESTLPMVVKLEFGNKWGYRGATLLKMYDDIVRHCLTAKHLGLYSQEDWTRLVTRSGQRLRGLFELVMKMPQTHFDRRWFGNKEFAGQMKKAKRKLSREGLKMPHIPDDILRGERKPNEHPVKRPSNEKTPLRELKNRPEQFERALSESTGYSVPTGFLINESEKPSWFYQNSSSEVAKKYVKNVRNGHADSADTSVESQPEENKSTDNKDNR